jgi:hypothetical protein
MKTKLLKKMRKIAHKKFGMQHFVAKNVIGLRYDVWTVGPRSEYTRKFGAAHCYNETSETAALDRLARVRREFIAKEAALQKEKLGRTKEQKRNAELAKL